MNFAILAQAAKDKSKFADIEEYISFALIVIQMRPSLQAEIVCQNDQCYRFWQLPDEGRFAISRPINTSLLLNGKELQEFSRYVLPSLSSRESVQGLSVDLRILLNRGVYSMQQMIGVALDALPSNESNFARKINGDLFERLIQRLIVRMGVDCKGSVVRAPVFVDGIEQCRMSFQHDLVVSSGHAVKIIGAVKTSSKDRIGKIFFDKYLLTALVKPPIPHVAVFLNDVQRGAKSGRSYRVSSTFLPGHFKAFTIQLNPLDGVYYCDLQRSMLNDAFLESRISSLDRFFCDDLWVFLDQAEFAPVVVEESSVLDPSDGAPLPL